ncbi:MAG: hypothetical protein AB7K35_10145 [Pseudorhodoplanes sp.]
MIAFLVFALSTLTGMAIGAPGLLRLLVHGYGRVPAAAARPAARRRR